MIVHAWRSRGALPEGRRSAFFRYFLKISVYYMHTLDIMPRRYIIEIYASAALLRRYAREVYK